VSDYKYKIPPRGVPAPIALTADQTPGVKPRKEFTQWTPQDWIQLLSSTGRREVGRLIGRKPVSVEHFRRRADECRRLAIDARNASDKAFWLGLVSRWQALETRETQQPLPDKSRMPRRRQSELASAD